MANKVAISIGAHPDDIEFYMAGTLLMLKKAGYQTHYLNLASGNCGSADYNGPTIRSIRNTEARAAARTLGASFHPSIADDLEIIYSIELLRALAAIIREVKPNIVLTHSPQDYMEDHTNTCRLAVTAAFARGIPNFTANRRAAAWAGDTTGYHAMPVGLCDGVRRCFVSGAVVDTSSVQGKKIAAPACHERPHAC